MVGILLATSLGLFCSARLLTYREVSKRMLSCLNAFALGASIATYGFGWYLTKHQELYGQSNTVPASYFILASLMLFTSIFGLVGAYRWVGSSERTAGTGVVLSSSRFQHCCHCCHCTCC